MTHSEYRVNRRDRKRNRIQAACIKEVSPVYPLLSPRYRDPHLTRGSISGGGVARLSDCGPHHSSGSWSPDAAHPPRAA